MRRHGGVVCSLSLLRWAITSSPLGVRALVEIVARRYRSGSSALAAEVLREVPEVEVVREVRVVRSVV